MEDKEKEEFNKAIRVCKDEFGELPLKEEEHKNMEKNEKKNEEARKKIEAIGKIAQHKKEEKEDEER